MYTREIMREDSNIIKQVISNALYDVPEEGWQAKTGTRDKDWTLHQTLAHLVAIAQALNTGADVAALGKSRPTNLPAQRDGLRDWNTAEIERLSKIPPNALMIRLRQELDAAVMRRHNFHDEQLQAKISFPIYNRPVPTIDFLDWQLSHIGIVHGAQIVATLEHPPLWEKFPEEMLPRMIDRYLRSFSYVYWPQYGQGRQVINFHVEQLGAWHIIADEDGGDMSEGALDDAEHDLFFNDAATLFQVFASPAAFKASLQSGALRFSQDWRDSMALIKLFSPMPPNL